MRYFYCLKNDCSRTFILSADSDVEAVDKATNVADEKKTDLLYVYDENHVCVYEPHSEKV